MLECDRNENVVDMCDGIHMRALAIDGNGNEFWYYVRRQSKRERNDLYGPKNDAKKNRGEKGERKREGDVRISRGGSGCVRHALPHLTAGHSAQCHIGKGFMIEGPIIEVIMKHLSRQELRSKQVEIASGACGQII